MNITTRVMEFHRGLPAKGVTVRLDRHDAGDWRAISWRTTAVDGTVRDWDPPLDRPGLYRLTFSTGDYFGNQGMTTCYPEISIAVKASRQVPEVHVPLLLSPFGYATY